MEKTGIDAQTLSRMFLAGASRLNEHKEIINELNVFPVPDGDTGTNMTMTILSAAEEVLKADRGDMAAVCKCISQGSLRGARGNSGVILSQLLRGFSKVAREKELLDVPLMAESFDKAVETAYKAVMKPKEGTILTVARGAAQRAQELAGQGVTDLDAFFAEITEYAEEVLQKTPDMLPVLKQAGVVDSGGQGLVEVLKGALQAFRDESLGLSLAQGAGEEKEEGVYRSGRAAQLETADIKFVYCTEFIILLSRPFTKAQEKDFKGFLESVGDSIVLVADEDLCKVHIHSNDPGLVIQRALTFGELSNMKIDNMRMEHRERLFSINYETGDYTELETEVSGMDAELRALNGAEPTGVRMRPVAEVSSGEAPQEAEEETSAPEEKKAIGFVAVCAGEGLTEILESLGVDVVISGGQTMNPSTADFIDAVERVQAETVFFLPNNKNIILAAEQAAKMVKSADIRVIPTKTIPQGIAAVVNYLDTASADENEEMMREAIGAVKSGEVTFAIRDTEIDGVQIHEGDYMGIGDDGILCVDADMEAVVSQMLRILSDSDSALISLYYGRDVSEEAASALLTRLQEELPQTDIELHHGGQPVYYYLLSVE